MTVEAGRVYRTQKDRWVDERFTPPNRGRKCPGRKCRLNLRLVGSAEHVRNWPNFCSVLAFYSWTVILDPVVGYCKICSTGAEGHNLTG